MTDFADESGVTFWYHIGMMSIDIIALMIYLVYFIGYYAHPEDSVFGGSRFARIMIYIGYFIGYGMLLTVQFDIYLTQRGVNIEGVYYAIQWI